MYNEHISAFEVSHAPVSGSKSDSWEMHMDSHLVIYKTYFLSTIYHRRNCFWPVGHSESFLTVAKEDEYPDMVSWPFWFWFN